MDIKIIVTAYIYDKRQHQAINPKPTTQYSYYPHSYSYENQPMNQHKMIII